MASQVQLLFTLVYSFHSYRLSRIRIHSYIICNKNGRSRSYNFFRFLVQSEPSVSDQAECTLLTNAGTTPVMGDFFGVSVRCVPMDISPLLIEPWWKVITHILFATKFVWICFLIFLHSRPLAPTGPNRPFKRREESKKGHGLLLSGGNIEFVSTSDQLGKVK